MLYIARAAETQGSGALRDAMCVCVCEDGTDGLLVIAFELSAPSPSAPSLLMSTFAMETSFFA